MLYIRQHRDHRKRGNSEQDAWLDEAKSCFLQCINHGITYCC